MNTVELSFSVAATPDAPETIRETLEAAVRGRISQDDLDNLALVCEEVVTNIVKYGYADGAEGDVDVSMRHEKDLLTLQFRDAAAPFDPLAQDDPDIDADIEDREIGGLGIFMVKQLAKSVNYARDSDYNVLTVDLVTKEP